MADEEIKYTIEELKDKLTEKERIFCHEYIIDYNATRSAKKAGYSQKTAKQIAYENLTKPYITQYINYIKDDIAKEANITKLSLIRELKKIAFSSLSQLHEDWITRKDFEVLKKQNPDILDVIQEIDTKVIRKVAKEFDADSSEFVNVPYDVEYVKIKLHDKRGAIQDILKAMGWNEPDKLEMLGKLETNQINLTINDEKIDLST